MKNTLLMIITCSLTLSSAQAADFMAVAAPDTAALTVADEGGDYLEVAYYDWGPEWSNVKRRQTTVEGEGEVRFTYDNQLVTTEAGFRIEGIWKKTAPDTLRFEATLTPAASSPLTMAQFGVSAGAEIAGVEGSATLADGTSVPVVFPVKRGPIGDQVKTLTLKDRAGRTTTMEFDQPIEITADQNARMVLVRGLMETGKTYSLAFTLTLPGPADFNPGPSKLPSSTDGWYPFTGESPIPAESEWSMASWLDAPAGAHGRITAQKDKLTYNGKPIKLWGINVSYANCAPDQALADRRADFYASLGINAVRLHKYAEGSGWNGILSPESAAAFDAAGLDRLDYFVAALKKRGIYVKLSPVFTMPIGPADLARAPYFSEFGTGKKEWIDPKHGSLYLSRELQDLLIRQMTTLLQHTNPHTGLTYAEDPAIAYIEFYNEDSALFYGTAKVLQTSPTLRARAGKLFADWLVKKYDTAEALLAAWGPRALNGGFLESMPRDESLAEGRVYPYGNPWFFDPDQLDGDMAPFKRRLLDTMAFLHELQNQFYARYAAALRDAGYGGEVLASNWQAGRAMSHFYNLHSDALIGTVDRHNYFGDSRNDRFVFNNASMVAVPGGGSLSASLQQVADRPFMLSEWIHVFPNEWGVEGPAILGAYGMGLQGWDASFAFQNGDNGTFAPALGLQNWDVVAPQFLGIFPAVSRQVLRGDVQESEVVHYRNVNLDALGEGRVGFEEKVAQLWDIKTFDSDVFPAAALAAAKGVVRFTEAFEETPAFDLAPYRKEKAIVSSSGQLRWSAGERSTDGHIAINTPGTQALIGFADGMTAEFADSSISPKSRYGAIYLTARAPEGTLARDEAILVTAIARARNEGAIVAYDRFFYSRGTAGKNKKPTGPVLMEPVVADLALTRRGTPVVHVLDHRGVKTGKTVPVENGRFQIDTGRDQSPYYLVTFDIP